MIEVKDVVPHAGDMVLLDGVVSYDDKTLIAEATIRESGPFFRAAGDPLSGGVAGVPAWVGIEFMAQAISAWSGLRGREKGKEPELGFLIGTRKYTSNRPVFPKGCKLRIEVRMRDKHDSLGIFECEIHCEDLKAEAVLSVYEGERRRLFAPGDDNE